MDYISELLTPNEIREILQELPSGLVGMFELAMKRIDNQSVSKKKLALHALSWVLLSKRRLEVNELRDVIAFELRGGHAMVSEGDLVEMDHIISACAGLVICAEDEVQFVRK